MQLSDEIRIPPGRRGPKRRIDWDKISELEAQGYGYGMIAKLTGYNKWAVKTVVLRIRQMRQDKIEGVIQ